MSNKNVDTISLQEELENLRKQEKELSYKLLQALHGNIIEKVGKETAKLKELEDAVSDQRNLVLGLKGDISDTDFRAILSKFDVKISLTNGNKLTWRGDGRIEWKGNIYDSKTITKTAIFAEWTEKKQHSVIRKMERQTKKMEKVLSEA